MSKILILVFFPLWTIGGATFADDMTFMKDYEIEALVDEYSRQETGYWEPAGNSKKVCIVDINGNIIRQTEVTDDYPGKNPAILDTFLDKSMFLLEVNGIYYYLYEFSFQGKKNSCTGNFFDDIFI
jgi:hypothetical protein